MAQVGLTKSAAQAILNQYSQTIDKAHASKKYSIDTVINTLQQKLDKVKSICQAAYSSLGYTGSIEENEIALNQTIKQMQGEVASLNGPLLAENFISQFQKAPVYNPSGQGLYEALLQTFASNNSTTTENTNLMAEELLRTVRGWGGDKGSIIVDSSGRVKNKLGQFIGQYKFDKLFKNLSKIMQKAIIDYCNKNNITPATVEEQYSDDQFFAYIRMNSKMGMQIQSTNSEFAPKFRAQVTQYILSVCPSAQSDKLTQAIDIVFRNNPSAFYIGDNSKQLTGLLGEIQGLYYFLRITNGQVRSNVDWIGSKNEHADLLLKTALGNFGIQIKNTSADGAIMDVTTHHFKSFSTSKGALVQQGQLSFNLTTDVSTAQKRLEISASVFDAIQSALAAYTFNIYYTWNSGQAVAVNENLRFADVRNRIIEYERKAQQIMYLYSAALMYIQTVKSDTSGTTNTFYLIAGSIIRSTFTILSTIIQQMKDELAGLDIDRSYSFKATTGYNKQLTIVDEINKGGFQNHKANTSFVFSSSYNFG